MLLDDLTLARVIHVISLIGWIGGVWFVTFVVMPAIARSTPASDRLRAFHRIEAGFAPQARVWVLLAGASGLWMTWRAGLWPRFESLSFWWMHAMVLLWLVFAFMLFIAEPLVLHRRMRDSTQPEADFRRLVVGHRILSLAALITVAGAMAGAHGLI